MKSTLVILWLISSNLLLATTIPVKNQNVWQKDNISVIAEVDKETSSSEVFLSLTFTNRSNQTISIVFPNNPMKMLHFDIWDKDNKPIALTEYAVREKEIRVTSGPLFHKIGQGTTFRLRINIAQYYAVQKMQSYSMNISGALLSSGKELLFEIKRIRFRCNK